MSRSPDDVVKTAYNSLQPTDHNIYHSTLRPQRTDLRFDVDDPAICIVGVHNSVTFTVHTPKIMNENYGNCYQHNYLNASVLLPL